MTKATDIKLIKSIEFRSNSLAPSLRTLTIHRQPVPKATTITVIRIMDMNNGEQFITMD